MSIEDPTKPVREGEELDLDVVSTLLAGEIADFAGDLQVRQFPGGASNLTYLLRFATDSGRREMVLRRPPFGTKPKSGHDMRREYRILNKLNGHFSYVPETLYYTDDESILGSEFYIMQRLGGVILRRDFPDGAQPPATAAKQLANQLVDVLVELHDVDYNAAGLADFGKPNGYVARQVSGWNARFEKAHTEDVVDGKAVMAWLHANQPDDYAQPSIIHNDYKFDNVMLDRNDMSKIIGVLDWEMSTLGDPLLDLGCALAYWVTDEDSDGLQFMRMGPTNLAGMGSRDDFVHRYCTARGIELDDYRFYRVFGLFRLAVILQQIYYRYFHKQTNNPRFQHFGNATSMLIQEAEAAIGGGS